MAAAAIFTFRLAWNEFILSFILTNTMRTLPASISNYITDTGVEWGKISTAGRCALPPLIFTAWLRSDHRGLTAAPKG
jgi:multiple sugar transport system permease protein